MTVEQKPTIERLEYNPFHHLHDLHWATEEGDPVVRLALMELINKLDVEMGPYLTALESTSFAARLRLAVYGQLFDESERQDYDDSRVRSVAGMLEGAIQSSLTLKDIDDHDNERTYNLSLPDMERILAAVKWTPEQVKILKGDAEWKVRSPIAKLPAAALSEPFSLKGFSESAIAIEQGGNPPYPIRKRAISKETGKFWMTWEACREWGLSIPKHPEFADDASVAVNIDFPKAPDGVILHVKSSTDDVPDGEGGTKSEQISASIKKGDTSMQLSLLNKNLKYHSWTFSIEEAA